MNDDWVASIWRMNNLLVFEVFVVSMVKFKAFLLISTQIWKIKGNHNQLLVDILRVAFIRFAALLEVEGLLVLWDLKNIVLAVHATIPSLMLNEFLCAMFIPLIVVNILTTIFVYILENFLHIFNLKISLDQIILELIESNLFIIIFVQLSECLFHCCLHFLFFIVG